MKNVSTVALTLLIGGLGIASQAFATPCSGNEFLGGNYGAQFSGTVTRALAGGIGGDSGRTGNVAGFATTSGRFTLDGYGKVTGTVSSNTNGAFLRGGAVVGTYSVKYEDCTVKITLTDGSGGIQHFDGVVAARGDTVLLIQTDKGAGLSGEMQRSRSSCANINMDRTYAFRRIGNTLSNPVAAKTSGHIAPQTAVPPDCSIGDGFGAGANALTAIGVLEADGFGNFTMTESVFTNDVFSRTVSSGTYSVNYDCSVVLNIVTSSAPRSATMLQGQLVNSDTQILWIQADNGVSVTGGFSAQ